jgi:hypothetical protein
MIPSLIKEQLMFHKFSLLIKAIIDGQSINLDVGYQIVCEQDDRPHCIIWLESFFNLITSWWYYELSITDERTWWSDGQVEAEQSQMEADYTRYAM